MAHNRRPTNNNNNNNENDFSAAGLEMPPSLATTGYQALRTSKDIQQQKQPQNVGEPMTFMTDQGRYYSGTCYWITIAVAIGLVVLTAVIVGVIVRHRTRTHIETKRCGTIDIPEDAICVDWIIGGCGTAGATAAREISADPTLSVLCVESGPDWYNRPDVLDASNFFGYIATIDETNANKYYYDLHGSREPALLGTGFFGPEPARKYFRGGRMLGGSACVNFQLTFRSDEDSWNEWDTLAGSPGTLTGASMYQIFHDIEYLNAHGHYAFDATRGDGSLPTQTVKIDVTPHGNIAGSDYESIPNFISAALSIPVYTDVSYNALGNRIGAYPYVEFLKDFDTTTPELRWSGRASFLGPDVMNQQTYLGVAPRQLQVLINSTISNILSVPTPSGPRFVGVHYKASDGNTKDAYARQGVIATFGLQTAAVLQRSGVGPSAVLEEAHVPPVILNDNVGEHFKVHVSPTIIAFWPNITATGVDADYIGTTFVMFAVEDGSPAGTPGRPGFALFAFGLAPGIFLIGGQLARPKSEGYIKIHSADPYHLPKIVSNALTHPDDLTSLRDFMRNTIYSMVAEDPGFFPLTIDPFTLASDPALNTFLATTATLPDHWFSTCRMGTSATTSVVDNRFRVFGAAEGSLRVCDTQAMPGQTLGNPYYATMGLGTLCGRTIIEEYGSAAAKKSMPVHRNPSSSSPSRTNDSKPKFVMNRRNSKAQAKTVPFNVIDDQTLWNAYQTAITTVREKFSPEQAGMYISAMMMTVDYKRLEAIYGAPSSSKKKTA